jgi:octaprenyl-diphosphate synthase
LEGPAKLVEFTGFEAAFAAWVTSSAGMSELSGLEDDGLVGRTLRVVGDELRATGELIAGQLDHLPGPLAALSRYLESWRGKLTRPTLVLLAGRAAGRLGEAHLSIAAAIELIHMASLLHDDVLDGSATRRGWPTLNEVHGDSTAVLLGDLLFSRAYVLAVSRLDARIAADLSRAASRVVEGEMMQIARRADFTMTAAEYLEVARKKTATLFSAGARLGAEAAGGSGEVVETFRVYGEALGTAFQIADDLRDLVGDEREAGKTLGLDLARRELTLPLIYYLDAAEPADRSGRGQRLRAADRERAAELCRECGALGRARAAALAEARRATDALKRLPESAARGLLCEMAEAVVPQVRTGWR